LQQYLLSRLAAFWQQQQQQQQQQQPPLNLNPKPYRCSKCLAQRQPHRQPLLQMPGATWICQLLTMRLAHAALQIVCDSSSSSSSSEGAFAGENAVACAGLQPLIATALLLQQCPWQLGGIVYHQTSSCHGTTYMCLLFACDVCSPALLP
jgi:hypothetical protein